MRLAWTYHSDSSRLNPLLASSEVVVSDRRAVRLVICVIFILILLGIASFS